LANRFALEDDGQAPHAYPEVYHFTRPLRARAIQAGDTNVPNLWGRHPLEPADRRAGRHDGSTFEGWTELGSYM
jgi:hypothetical protein